MRSRVHRGAGDRSGKPIRLAAVISIAAGPLEGDRRRAPAMRPVAQRE
jgi:hypothetical protein